MGCIAWASPEIGAFADPLMTSIFVVFAFRAMLPNALNAVRVLMETSPDDVDVDILRKTLEGVDPQLVVRDLHCWSVSMTNEDAMGSMRATVARQLQTDEHRMLVRRAEAAFAAVRIFHATVQIEGGTCDGEKCKNAEYPCLVHARTYNNTSSRCYK